MLELLNYINPTIIGINYNKLFKHLSCYSDCGFYVIKYYIFYKHNQYVQLTYLLEYI